MQSGVPGESCLPADAASASAFLILRCIDVAFDWIGLNRAPAFASLSNCSIFLRMQPRTETKKILVAWESMSYLPNALQKVYIDD